MTKKRQNKSKSPKNAPEYITERIKVEKMIPGGQAIATLASGQKLMLWNALPNEIVTRVELTKHKSHYLEGIATNFVQTSPQRVQPRDECYLSTSPWQILDYPSELSYKQELLCEIFRQHDLKFAGEISPVQTDGEDFFYRNKMEYSLYYDHDRAEILPAFHARGSHRKVPVLSSSLERPEVWQAMQKIIADLNARGEEARKYQSILLRANQAGQISGGLFENHRPHPHFPTLHDTILGQTYSYSPNGFFQINLPVYELALQEMQKHLTTDDVLDLYAGVGTIGLSIARERKLTLVECDGMAYRELEENCRSASEAGATSIQPIQAKSEEALDYISADQTVIFDPPRAGCEGRLLARILEILPATLLYLSCNPVTQARDVKILSAKYDLVAVVPFNFFPRTPHLENLIVLKRH